MRVNGYIVDHGLPTLLPHLLMLGLQPYHPDSEFITELILYYKLV